MRLEGENKLVRQAKNDTNYIVWFCKPIILKNVSCFQLYVFCIFVFAVGLLNYSGPTILCDNDNSCVRCPHPC